MNNLTEKGLSVIQSAMRQGWNIVPYWPKIKLPPKGFSWGYSTERMKLTTVDEVIQHDAEGKLMAFVLETANVLLVDIDCAVPMYHDQRGSRDYEDHRDDTHEIWDSFADEERWAILIKMEENAIKAGLEPHASMPSSSAKGYHGYYKCKSRKTDPSSISRFLTDISTPDPCIEIYANWRLAYPTNWELFENVLNAEPIPYEKVVRYWSETADKFNSYRIMKRQAVAETPPPLIKTDTGNYTMDYERLVANSSYAQIGKKCRLFVWLVKALQIGDHDGYEAGIRDAQMNGLSESKIQDQATGAKRTAARNPNPQFVQATVYENYTPRRYQ